MNIDRLKEYLDYSEDTGDFTWKKTTSNHVKVEDKAGVLSKGYVKIGILSQQILAHRLAWAFKYGSFPVADLDHINGNRNDNRIANLRETTRGINTQNRKDCKGYTKTARVRKPWCASIKVNYKRKFLGYFETEDEARQAYLKAKRELHPFFVEN